jgi:hypothetical protein
MIVHGIVNGVEAFSDIFTDVDTIEDAMECPFTEFNELNNIKYQTLNVLRYQPSVDA